MNDYCVLLFNIENGVKCGFKIATPMDISKFHGLFINSLTQASTEVLSAANIRNDNTGLSSKMTQVFDCVEKAKGILHKFLMHMLLHFLYYVATT